MGEKLYIDVCFYCVNLLGLMKVFVRVDAAINYRASREHSNKRERDRVQTKQTKDFRSASTGAFDYNSLQRITIVLDADFGRCYLLPTMIL